MSVVKKMIGRKFARLKLLKAKNSRSVAEFKCECGAIVHIPYHSAAYGNTKSCGCLLTEHIKRINKERRLKIGKDFKTKYKSLRGKTLKQIAKRLGISYNTMYYRLRRGKTLDQAIKMEKQQRYYKNV